MVKLYLDEDIHGLLAPLLRARNISAVTTQESKMLGKDDRQQLEYSVKTNAVFVTHNRVDFEKIFADYVKENKTQHGIIILIRRDVYTMATRLSHFVLSHDDISNQLWYV